MGLGLAIVGRIAAAAGGRLLLASSPGAGARARIDFPAL
jgi:two-component system sensor histidine kinase TctE